MSRALTKGQDASAGAAAAARDEMQRRLDAAEAEQRRLLQEAGARL